jgi:hypothetical protein
MHKDNLLVHAGGAALADLLLLGLLLVDTLVHELGVLVLGAVSDCPTSDTDIFHELTAASLEASAWRRLSAILWRLCWRRWGVTRRWMRGALV